MATRNAKEEAREVYDGVVNRIRKVLKPREAEIADVVALLQDTRKAIEKPKGGIIRRAFGVVKSILFAYAKPTPETEERILVVERLGEDTTEFSLKLEVVQKERNEWKRRLIMLGFPEHIFCQGKGCESCDWTGVDYEKWSEK